MTQHYSNPERASDPGALPDIETFRIGNILRGRACFRCESEDAGPHGTDFRPTFHNDHVGWYWQPCFPGCLPDGEPCGPFESEELALADAREVGGEL